MVLNLEQQKAVASGKAVLVNVGGTECVLLRRDIFLRLDPDFDAGARTLDEINLLADEANELISQREAHEP
jgi:hypothetical protein